MGKGDKRSKKGKIRRGSYGVSRPRTSRFAPVDVEKKAKKAAEAAKPAAPAKKAEEKPKKEATKAPAKPSGTNKDLVKIEGIGPKISGILTDAGVGTFAKLAEASADDLRAILAEAGSRYKAHDPSTWPEQAALAAADKWDELKKLQDELDGGKKK